jgi:RNA polymerase sigma factor (sigma-70 family)
MGRSEIEDLLATVERSANYLANRVSKSCKIEFDDAKQELMIAAFQAYKTYDASQAKFTTYSVWRMKKTALTLINSRMHDHVDRNTLTETELESPDSENSLLEGLLVDSASDPYYSVLDRIDEEIKSRASKAELDEVEELLRQLSETTGFAYARQSYEIFRKMRYCEVLRDGKYFPISVTEIAAEMGMLVQRVSTLFAHNIVPLGTPKGRARIREQIATAAETARRKQEATMAQAKKSSKVTKQEDTKAGRKPKAGGLQEKIAYLEKVAVAKGKTRSEAVKIIMEKYPEMTINYARTVVYSGMKNSDWPATERKAPAPKAKKTEKATPTTKKSAPKTEAKPDKVPKAKATKAAAAPADDDDFDF